uniref:Uncharacterized protein n=1 Tax=Brassica campestris TaxID=3711 RepID=A0A3P6D3T2_BRACM|nr:unnamed protein product [Brassica rapa]
MLKHDKKLASIAHTFLLYFSFFQDSVKDCIYQPAQQW